GRYPRAAGSGLAVAEALLAGPPEVAIVGQPGDERTRELHRTALLAAPPGTVIAIGDGQQAAVPLLEGRGLVGGAPAAYVCRNFTCQRPVTEPDRLRDALAAALARSPRARAGMVLDRGNGLWAGPHGHVIPAAQLPGQTAGLTGTRGTPVSWPGITAGRCEGRQTFSLPSKTGL
ncbi:MAG TPA: hypothetical protein VKV80_20280, partial [Streptosporangiaceae bacterium]|nr:hypothetical protein [Streptosporangiaceae bacterium]